MNPIYCKYSGERDPRYQIKTTIQYNEDGEKTVRKYPLTDSAVDHVEKMFTHYLQMEESFSGTVLKPNKCKKLEKCVEFEFLKGETLEAKLDRICMEGKYLELAEEIKKYRDILYGLKDNIAFSYTKEFEEVFGSENRFSNCTSLKISNIDLVFGNILVGEKWTVLDYEWIFDFPVPIEFIFYRAVFYYIHRNPRKEELKKMHFLRLLGITDEAAEIYRKMELRFQQHVVGNKITLAALKPSMLRNRIDVQELVEKQNMDYVQIYFNEGAGYQEENSVKKCYCWREKRVDMDIDLKRPVGEIRIDPASTALIVKKLEIIADGERVYPSCSNGLKLQEDSYFFAGEDPQMIIPFTNEKKKIHLCFEVFSIPEEWKEEAELLEKMADQKNDSLGWRIKRKLGNNKKKN